MGMNDIFQACVDLLNAIASMLNMTYKEVNVWIFCIIWPIITIVLIFLTRKYYLKSKKY